MKILMARHTETNYNTLGLSNGDPAVDVHLTKRGIQQARLLSSRLKRARFEAIIISELKRTRQTADVINKHHSRPLVIDPRLNDVRMGFEGRPVREHHNALKNVDDMWSVRFNDGESLRDVKMRVESFLKQLRQQSYDSVLIVTHLSIIQIAYGLLRNLSDEASLTVEVIQGKYLEVET